MLITWFYIALCNLIILIHSTSTQKIIGCPEIDTVTKSISDKPVFRFFKYHRNYFYSQFWKFNFNKKIKIKIKRDAEYKGKILIFNKFVLYSLLIEC